MWKEYYTTKRMHTFSQFLTGIKYAILKVFENLDILTMIDNGESTTMWEKIKKTGKYNYSKDGIVIDIEYKTHIYIAIKL